MTAEVLAAIQGAREAGATEFVISDSHGNGQSLLIDRLPTDIPITVVRAFPRPLGMMEGIDSSFAAVIFIGYHTSTTSLTGVRAHTMSSALLTRVAINGTSMSEAGVNAAIAAHFGVPVVMITGDDQIVAETKQRLGPIEGVAVKRAIGFHGAATMVPEVAQALIRQTREDRRGASRRDAALHDDEAAARSRCRSRTTGRSSCSAICRTCSGSIRTPCATSRTTSWTPRSSSSSSRATIRRLLRDPVEHDVLSAFPQHAPSELARAAPALRSR